MAKGNKLYSAYRGAGKAAAGYKASLYDIENLGIEREASQAMYQFQTTQRDKTLALVQQGIGLVSDIAGGFKSKADAKEARGKVQEGMAKKSYEGDVPWEQLTDKARDSEIGKFAPTKVKRSLGEILTGSERKYTFGKGGDEYTSSQITAASSLYGENKLADMLGIGSSSKLEELQESVKESSSAPKEEENYAPVLQDESGLDYSVVPGFESKKRKHEHPKDKDSYSKMIDNVISPKTDKETGLPSYLFKEPGGKSLDLSNIGNFEIPSLLDNTKTVKYGGSWAKGGEFTTDGPELILVGDNPGGKEKVKVKPIKSKSNKTEGQESLSDNVGASLKDLVSKKGTKPGSKKWMSNYIQSQKVNNQSLRPLQGELSKHNKKLFSMAEESGYFGEFFRGGWE